MRYVNIGPNFTIPEGPLSGIKYKNGKEYDESQIPVTNRAFFVPVEEPVIVKPQPVAKPYVYKEDDE